MVSPQKNISKVIRDSKVINIRAVGKNQITCKFCQYMLDKKFVLYSSNQKQKW